MINKRFTNDNDVCVDVCKILYKKRLYGPELVTFGVMFLRRGQWRHDSYHDTIEEAMKRATEIRPG